MKKQAEDTRAILDFRENIISRNLKHALMKPSTSIIQIVVVEPMKRPYKQLISNTLEAFNDLVKGYFETIYIADRKDGTKIALVLNEDRNLLEMPINRKIVTFDLLVGTFFITACNGTGSNISLTDEEADYYINRFSPFEVHI